MFYYKLRIDTQDKDLAYQVVEKYSPNVYVIAFEKVGTIDQHCHYYLETEIADTTIRRFIQSKIGSGNKIYSLVKLKEERPIEYLAYLTKEGEYHFKGLDLTNALAYDDKVKQELKTKKAKPKTVFAQLDEDYLKSEAYEIVQEHRDWQKLAMFIIQWHIQNSKTLAKFRIQSYVETLAVKYHDYGPMFAYKIVEHM